MRPYVTLALLALVLSAPAQAGDVEMRLTTGERVFGELLVQNADAVTINRKVWTKNGLIAGRADYARGRIAAMEPVASLDDLYKKHAAEVPDTYDGQFSLAKWCADRGLQDQAFATAKKLYDRDSSDQVTKDLLGELGYVLDGAQWVKESDYAAKHGLVIYDGKMLTPEQVELRKAAIKADVDHENADVALRSLDGKVAQCEKRVTDAKARIDKLRQQQNDIKKQEGQAKQQRGNQRNGNGNGNGGRGGGGQQQQQQQNGGVNVDEDYSDLIKQLDKQIAEAQKSVDAANKDLQTAKENQAKGKEADDAAQKAADAAHQAVTDSMPKDDAAKPGDATKPADPAKPVDKSAAK
jgi:hypothetical protein